MSIPASGSSIRNICFDLGGVVVRICRSWEEGCARAGLDVRAGALRESTRPIRHQAVVDYQTGRIDCRTFAERVSAALDGAYTPDEVMAIHRAWTMDEYPGVLEVIDRIHAAGFETSCLSNTNHSHWCAIATGPAFTSIRLKLASHELGLHKPDPDIYHEAERRIGCPGRDILFFDDTEENVHAARESGWKAVHIDHRGETDRQIAEALRDHGIDLG